MTTEAPAAPEGSRSKKAAPVVTAAATATTAADAPEGEKKPRGSSKYSPTSVVVVATPERANPKNVGTASYERFALYPTTDEGVSVADALKLGIWSGDINWDFEHGFISIDGVANPIKVRKAPVPSAETLEKRKVAAELKAAKAEAKAKEKAEKAEAKEAAAKLKAEAKAAAAAADAAKTPEGGAATA